MLLLSLLVASALGNEALVPAFRAVDDQSAISAEAVYAAVVDALGDRDIAFLDAKDLKTFLGDAATDCVARTDCPGNLWMDIEGDLALLGTVKLNGDQVDATVNFHRRGSEGSIEVFQAVFAVANASRFAVDAALIAEDLLAMSDEDLAAIGGVAAVGAVAAGAAQITEDALGPISPETPSEPEPEPEPVAPAPAAQPERGNTPDPTPEALGGRISDVEMDEEQERRYMGLTVALYEEYKKSGQGRVAFLAAKKYRAKTFYAELAPGFVFGDVQRRYTAIAYVEDNAAKGYYERDQFLPGTAFSLVAGFGYAPTWWLEVGLNLGIEFPKKDFISGYEAYNGSPEDFKDGANCPEFCDLVPFKPATALTFLIEPRVRVLMRPTGLVKPYAIVGWATRLYDGYDTPDATTVAYPNRSGAQTFGPLGGLGVGFDPRKKASAFIEASYTRLLGPGIHDTNVSVINNPPEALVGNDSVVAVRVGAVTRF